MSVQVHYHGSTDAACLISKQVAYEQCDIRIWTKTTAMTPTAMVEASADVNSPAPFQCQSSCQNRSSCLVPTTVKDKFFLFYSNLVNICYRLKIHHRPHYNMGSDHTRSQWSDA
ncbi:hypothetical protein J6590_092910 [Homalodisca vitripennis]|nr:hypothetical protein J6590_092910 [Homalodisca vitripennis]